MTACLLKNEPASYICTARLRDIEVPEPKRKRVLTGRDRAETNLLAEASILPEVRLVGPLEGDGLKSVAESPLSLMCCLD